MTWAAALHDVGLVVVCVMGCLFSFHMGLTIRLENLMIARGEVVHTFEEPVVPRRERGEMIVVDSDD